MFGNLFNNDFYRSLYLLIRERRRGRRTEIERDPHSDTFVFMNKEWRIETLGNKYHFFIFFFRCQACSRDCNHDYLFLSVIWYYHEFGVAYIIICDPVVLNCPCTFFCVILCHPLSNSFPHKFSLFHRLFLIGSIDKQLRNLFMISYVDSFSCYYIW